MSSTRQLITVFGATGAQGGSVARALLKDGEFSVRAVTRNPDSNAAKKLKDQGAELFKADADDAESVKAALEGTYGCFAVTDFWAHMDMKREVAQGENIVQGCKANNIKHLVYSSLENVKELAGFDVPHFDGKSHVADKIKAAGLPNTLVQVAQYHENFLQFFINKTQDGNLGIALPMGFHPLLLIEIDGLGGCVVPVFKNADKYKGETLSLASDEVKVDKIVEIFNKHFEQKFVNMNVSLEQFAKFEFPGADEFAQMFRFYQHETFKRDVKLTKSLNPDIQDLDTWVKSNKDKLSTKFKEL